MKVRTIYFAVIITWACWLVAACDATDFTSPLPQVPGIVDTLAAQTLSAFQAEATFSATSVHSPSPTSTNVITATPELPRSPSPTITPLVVQTQAALPSLTPYSTTQVPSSTPDLTLVASSGTPSGTIAPCNAARFEADISYPDGTQILPSTTFTKIWRIKNIGSCTWDNSYQFVFLAGDRMGGIDASLPVIVKPGESLDIAINLLSPSKPGNYKGNWMLRSGGVNFGAGSSGTMPFFVLVEVVNKNTRTIYNFANNLCAATWESNSGKLPCPGKEWDPQGFVTLLLKPRLETRPENEPAIWSHPQLTRDGWISATFPGIVVQSGYHFMADVGCLENYKRCDVMFEVYHRTAGPPRKLGEWHQVYDKGLTRIDIDLSAMSNSQVSLILVVRTTGDPDAAAAFWLQPQIRTP